MASSAPDNQAAPDAGYIAALKRVIEELHECSSEHLETAHVHETFLGRTVWQGPVEVFAVTDHPRARKCYAWIRPQLGKRKRSRFFAVLGNSAVQTPLDAVKFVLVASSAPLINEFSKLGEHIETEKQHV
jgi:hypothetical protein